MPLIDLPELMDDLWYGAPNWFLPYVDGVVPSLGSEEAESAEVGSAGLTDRHRVARSSFSIGGWWNAAFLARSEPGTATLGSTPSNSGQRDSFDEPVGNRPTLPYTPNLPGFSIGAVSGNSERTPEEDSHVGTWGERQTNFQVITGDDGDEAKETPNAERLAQRDGTDANDDLAWQNKAWEWRFRQRWAKEHMQDPNPQNDHEDDGLAFVQKHGAHGWQQQFEMNDDDGAALARLGRGERSVSQDMMFGLLATPTPTPDNRSNILRRASNSEGINGEATQKISQQAQQAKELVRQQVQIDMDVQKRWSACKSEDSWVGNLLRAHVFDMAGEMKYYLLKVEQHKSGHQRLLVRAKRSICNEDAAKASVIAELQSVADEKLLECNGVNISVLGAGSMIWNNDSSIRLSNTRGTARCGPSDVETLTASLLRQSVAVRMAEGENSRRGWRI